MNPDHHFHLEVHAPHGLAGIEPHLTRLRLPFEPYFSQFTQQVILRLADSGDAIEFDMQGSLTDTMHGSGYLTGMMDEAVELLGRLSNALQAAGFPHRIKLDDALTGQTVTIAHPPG